MSDFHRPKQWTSTTLFDEAIFNGSIIKALLLELSFISLFYGGISLVAVRLIAIFDEGASSNF